MNSSLPLPVVHLAHRLGPAGQPSSIHCDQVQPFKIQEDDRMQAEKFLEFIFDQVQSQREDEQGITRKDFEAALAASWATYGDCFEQSDDVSEDLAEQPVGPLEFVDHFLFLDPAEPLHGLRLLQPPPEPWPDICLPKKAQHPSRDVPEMVKEDTVEALVETTAAPAIVEDTVESVTEEMLDDLPLDSVDPVADPKVTTMETSAFAMESLPPVTPLADPTDPTPAEPAEPAEPTVPVTELPRAEPIEAQATATAVQSAVIVTEPTDSEDDEPADKTWSQRPEEPEQDDETSRILKLEQAQPSEVVHVENMALEDEVLPMHNEDDKAEPGALQIIEVRDDSRQMKYSPPENWFSDDVIPAVPPPPVLPEVVQQQDPSGGLPLIPSARGNPPERHAWGSESASVQKALELPSMLSTTANTSQEESQRLALPCSDTVPTLTFSPQDDVAVQRPSQDQEAIVALPFDASPDVGSTAPESARTEPLSLLTPRTDLEVTGVSEALATPTSHGPVSETRLATAPVVESQEQLVPAPQERRRSSFAGIREQLQTETHPVSQPRSLEPAKPQVNFAPQRLSQICLRNGEEDAPSGRDGGGGSTIHDDFRQLPRKLQAQVASLYQELEDAKDSKRRAEQENTEIMNYLSVILSDDRPEQFALMDGPLTSLPPGPLEEDEKEFLPDDMADTKDKTEVAQQLEPPPPLPFPSEHLQASPAQVNINFGGGPPEGWGSSHEPRRTDQVLQDSLASVLPMAFRQLFERPQSWAEQQEQFVRERQQLQEGLQVMQQQLQQLQQQISQGLCSGEIRLAMAADPSEDELRSITDVQKAMQWAGFDVADLGEETIPGSLLKLLGLKPNAAPRIVGVFADEDLQAMLGAWKIPGQAGAPPRLPVLAETGIAKLFFRACQLVAGTGVTLQELKAKMTASSAAPPAQTPQAAAAATQSRKIKLSSIISQIDDSEVMVAEEKDILKCYSRYESVFGAGERPAKDCEPTAEQLSCLIHIISTGQPPYTDFSVFGPFGHRMM
eukprot:s25_g47.t1